MNRLLPSVLQECALMDNGFEAYLPPSIHWLPTCIQDLGHDLDESIIPIHAILIYWPHFLNVLVF